MVSSRRLASVLVVFGQLQGPSKCFRGEPWAVPPVLKLLLKYINKLILQQLETLCRKIELHN